MSCVPTYEVNIIAHGPNGTYVYRHSMCFRADIQLYAFFPTVINYNMPKRGTAVHSVVMVLNLP